MVLQLLPEDKTLKSTVEFETENKLQFLDVWTAVWIPHVFREPPLTRQYIHRLSNHTNM